MISEIRRGWNYIGFLEKLEDGYDPLRVFHNPRLRQEHESFLEDDGFLFNLGMYLNIVHNPLDMIIRLVSYVNVQDSLLNAYVAREKELERKLARHEDTSHD